MLSSVIDSLCGSICGGDVKAEHEIPEEDAAAAPSGGSEPGAAAAAVVDDGFDKERGRTQTPPPRRGGDGEKNHKAEESPTSVAAQLTPTVDPPVPKVNDEERPASGEASPTKEEEKKEEDFKTGDDEDEDDERSPSPSAAVPELNDSSPEEEERQPPAEEEEEQQLPAEEKWEHAQTDLTSSSWTAYASGVRRSKLFLTPKYSEFLTRAPPVDAASAAAPLNGTAAAVNRALTAAGAKNTTFDPKACLWKADLPAAVAEEGGKGNEEEEEDYRINVRIYAFDNAEKSKKEDDSMEDYVVTTRLIGGKEKKPEKNRALFKEIDASVQSAVVRHELTAYANGAKGTSGRRFSEAYELGKELNSGAYATVYLGKKRETGEPCAVKVINRKKLSALEDAVVLFEVLIQTSVGGHPNVVRLNDFFEEKDKFYLVMELMSGGDLFDRIGTKKMYSERDARELVQNLLKALSYCHERGIAHRDLKPKNMMLSDDTNDAVVKLADFGLSARMVGPKSFVRLCGSPFYVAPELLLKQPYDESSDMWSVGVIGYLLLGGTVPFNGGTLKEIFQKVVDGKYDFELDPWKAVSGEAKDFVRSLLKKEATERPTAVQALQHRWFQVKDKKLEMRDLRRSAASLRRFELRMKFKSAVFAVQGTQRIVGAGGYEWQYRTPEGIREDAGAKENSRSS